MQHTLTANVQGQGTVALDPSGGTYDAGTEVTLTATAEDGWRFDHWEGDASGAANPTTVTVDAAKTVTAVFVTQHALTVIVQGQGTVALDPSGGTYDAGTAVTLTATPAAGWAFDRWEGDATGEASPTTVTLDGDKTVTAVFTDLTPRVRLQTSMGDIVVELDRAAAPVTVANFLQYVEEGFYDGTDGQGATVFHRVAAGFVIQGGGLTADLTTKETHDPIVNEASNGLENDRGTIAMARTSDPDSATSQFFINLVDNDFLNYVDEARPGYAVFGRVMDGLDVVDAIAAVETETRSPYTNVPKTTIAITSAAVVAE